MFRAGSESLLYPQTVWLTKQGLTNTSVPRELGDGWSWENTLITLEPVLDRTNLPHPKGAKDLKFLDLIITKQK